MMSGLGGIAFTGSRDVRESMVVRVVSEWSGTWEAAVVGGRASAVVFSEVGVVWWRAQVGGSKISSKITVIESLMNVCDKVILGGGMIFTFFKADGKSVGSSLVEDDKIELAKNLVKLAKEKGVELILPVDVLAADKFAPDASVQTCSSSEIPDGEDRNPVGGNVVVLRWRSAWVVTGPPASGVDGRAGSWARSGVAMERRMCVVSF